MKDKRIKFSVDELLSDASEYPKPAVKTITSWFKKISPVIEGEQIGSVKKCIPFLDAMTAGYTITAHCDLMLVGSIENDKPKWEASWSNDGLENLITDHNANQVNGHPYFTEPAMVLKYNQHFIVETPPGYSCLFTPMLNDPTLQLSGVYFQTAIVDTDEYKNNQVNLPFFFRNFTGRPVIIKKGTPLVQVIPFKRESWKSEQHYIDQTAHKKFVNKLTTMWTDRYKKMFWKQKNFK
jgi:hypothetical protein